MTKIRDFFDFSFTNVHYSKVFLFLKRLNFKLWELKGKLCANGNENNINDTILFSGMNNAFQRPISYKDLIGVYPWIIFSKKI